MPQSSAFEGFFHFVIHDAFVVFATHAQTVSHVLVNRFRERVRFLEHHADTHAHFNRVYTRIQHIGIVRVHYDITLVFVTRVQVVHTVKTAQERRFTAARGANQRGDFILIQRHADAFECTGAIAVEKV
jgi:hypothetical protein